MNRAVKTTGGSDPISARYDGAPRETYWDALLDEVPMTVGRMLPTMVALRESPGAGWKVHARLRGDEMVEAEDLDYDEAVDLVMGIFARFMDEARGSGRIPLRPV